MSKLRVTVSIGVGDAPLNMKMFYTQIHKIFSESEGTMEKLTEVGSYKVTWRGI